MYDQIIEYLDHIGFSYSALDSFLYDRTQYVQTNRGASSTKFFGVFPIRINTGSTASKSVCL